MENKLRFFTADGELIPSPEGQAKQERQRAEQANCTGGFRRSASSVEPQTNLRPAIDLTSKLAPQLSNLFNSHSLNHKGLSQNYKIPAAFPDIACRIASVLIEWINYLA